MWYVLAPTLMGKILVIAEKPSVADEYVRVLGGAFQKHDGFWESDTHIVSWARGHLVGLAEPEVYDRHFQRWSMSRLPILPDAFQLEPDAKGETQLNVLASLLTRQDVEMIVNGCDAGREGELIFAYIMDWVKIDKPVQRLWVSSMTRAAIQRGFDDLKPGQEFASLAAAARSRSEADWLVGMNATRAATVRGRALGGVVSLGRVQTPTLALIVRRDAEIDAFTPEMYFEVDARFQLDGATPVAYAGRWFDGPEGRIPERQRAEAIVKSVAQASSHVESVTRRRRRQTTPQLYDLTALQREANSRFGMTAARTLAAAQRLYEGTTAGAVLTYPRTNSKFLPTDQAPRIPEIASQLTNDPRYREAATYVVQLEALPLDRVIDDARVEDHHAIIPTGELPRKTLSGDDARVFDMVVRRFLAVFYPDAVWEDTEVITVAANERFRTRASLLVEPGWQAVYDMEPDASRADDSLSDIQQNARGACSAAELHERQTRPPAHYSEASLLHEMERAGKRGLGTPATRAETIEKLVRVKYLERVGRTLRATAKARMAIAILGESPLTSAELTGQWEDRLYAIEYGTDSYGAFMSDIRAFTADVVEYFRNLTADGVRALWKTVGRCPNGDGDVRENRYAYSCTSWRSAQEPGCGFVIWKKICGRTIGPAEASALLESGATGVLDGFRTDPTRGRLELVNNQVRVVGEDGAYLDVAASERDAIALCPRCRQANVIENSRGFGCASWAGHNGGAGCDFVIWKKIHGHQVTSTEAQELIDRGQTGPHAFRSGRRDYQGMLKLRDDFTVEAETTDGTVLTARRARPQVVAERSTESATPLNGSARPSASTTNGISANAPADDLLSILTSHAVEVIDKRTAGGALWVVGGPELEPVMDGLAGRGFKFVSAPDGSRATKHRPGWWIRDMSER